MTNRSAKRNIISLFFDANSILLSVFTITQLANFIPMLSIERGMLSSFLLIIVPMFWLSNISLGLYEPKIRDSIRGVFRRLVLSAGLTFVFVGITQACLEFFLYPAAWPSISTLTVLLIAACASTGWRFWAFEKGGIKLAKRRVLIVGSGDRAAFLSRRMRRDSDRKSFDIVGFIQLEKGLDPDIGSYEVIFNEHIESVDMNAVGESLLKLVEQHQPDIILLANERKEKIPTSHLLMCKMSGINVCEIEDFIEHEINQIAVEHLREEWLLTASGFNLGRPWFDVFHYALNASLALVMLILVSPIMLLTALAIYLDDGRRDHASFLYKQVRTGLNGKPFNVLKFRSMGNNAEKNGAQWASANDTRVTRIGGFLRKYRIDELPQLLNILRGDMCFVGPRPERPVFVNKLAETIPYFHYRHSVKPGLTGWAQVKYPYGATIADSHEKLKYDLYYIKHRSVLLDIYILIRTVEVVLYGKGR